MSGRYKMPPPARYAVNTVLRLCGQRRRRRFPPQRGPPRLLVVCEDCGFSSRHRVIVARHWRFCRPTPSGPRFSCDRCAWTSDTAATYADHRRTAHGNRVIITYVLHVFTCRTINVRAGCDIDKLTAKFPAKFPPQQDANVITTAAILYQASPNGLTMQTSHFFEQYCISTIT